MIDELVRRITQIEQAVDGLIKPEVGWQLITDQTLAANAASVTLSSIPGSFRHLMVFSELRSTTAAETDVLLMRMNADAAANYDIQALEANNATVTGVAARASTSIGIGRIEGANSRASNASPVIIWIAGYTFSLEKWALGLSASFGDVSADGDLRIAFRGGRWRSTAIITSLTFLTNSGTNLVAGSRVQLYGVG